MPIVHPHDLLDDVIVIQSEGISKSISTSQKEHRTEETGTLYCSDVNPFVIVGSQCGAAVLRGADIFAPGILAIPYGISCGETIENTIAITIFQILTSANPTGVHEVLPRHGNNVVLFDDADGIDLEVNTKRN